ncbi:MAG: ClpX C4-type zinc finger protein [Hyphomicrobium sp.]
MIGTLIERLDGVLTDFWAEISAGGDEQQRLDSAIGAYLLARSLPDGAKLASAILHPLIFAAEDLAKKSGEPIEPLKDDPDASQNCSFCGKKEVPANVAGGVNGRICKDCVKLLYEQFAGQ